MCQTYALPAAGETALSLAAGAGQLETVDVLLAAGADPGLCAPGSAAPLHRAASSGVEVWDDVSTERRPTCCCHMLLRPHLAGVTVDQLTWNILQATPVPNVSLSLDALSSCRQALIWAGANVEAAAVQHST